MMDVLFFGQLTDITGHSQARVMPVPDTDELEKMLLEKYPGLQEAKYRLAVDKKFIHQNTKLAGTETIALMPPFSGG